jgi:calcineurin-like phosphoesterase family protein
MKDDNYPIIPMTDIDPEARRLAVEWFESDVKEIDWIGDKHKLASDIMNYAKKQNQNLIKEFAEFLLQDYEMGVFENDDLCWVLAGTKQKYSTEKIYGIWKSLNKK